MARLNTRIAKTPAGKTSEGAPAARINAEQALRRSVMSCLLWENGFYEDGQEISKRIEELAAQVPANKLAALAIEVRTEGKLRHVPLLLLAILCKTGSGSRLVSDTIYQVIQRPDELAELLAIYWRNGKDSLSSQLKKGLARAFTKFSEYQIAKYNRDNEIKLRDVLFLSHGKPKDSPQSEMWKRLIDKSLAVPDTWEVALSAGDDKKETFTRLIKEDNLGYLALLRNLRNMTEAGVDDDLIREAILAGKGGFERVLPFRYVAAARIVPRFEPALDAMLLKSIEGLPKLSGKTIVLVDISGSMDEKLSAKSDMTRVDAAAALASIINSDRRVFTFSSNIVEVPARAGMAGIETIIRSQPHGSTNLGFALSRLDGNVPADRIIVITDEQSHDAVAYPASFAKGYMINVATDKHGVGYGRWTHIDGFSENVIRFIHELEQGDK